MAKFNVKVFCFAILIVFSFIVIAGSTTFAVDGPVQPMAPTSSSQDSTSQSTSGTDTTGASKNCSNDVTFFGIPAWYQYLSVIPDTTGGCSIDFEATGGKTIVLILLAVVDILFRLGAIAAVVFVVYGGFMFVTSAGDPAKIVSARKAILNAVIGLIIVILASQIVKFIAKFLQS